MSRPAVTHTAFVQDIVIDSDRSCTKEVVGLDKARKVRFGCIFQLSDSDVGFELARFARLTGPRHGTLNTRLQQL